MNPKIIPMLATLLLSAGEPVHAGGDTPGPTPRPEGWFTGSGVEVECAPGHAAGAARRARPGEEERARLRWWSAGGPAYRWNELALQALLDDFVTLPLAARHLALVHAAVDDAVAAAVASGPSRRSGGAHARPACRPSEHAAAAAAAAEVLGYVLPARAQAFAALAEEAVRARVDAGADRAGDAEAGRELGRRVAALAIARGRTDRSDLPWTGTVPQGPGKWQGTNPVAPQAAGWVPMVLSSPDALRPPPPPAFDSEETVAALAELKAFPRTGRTNHRATYWEVFGGARAHVLWNETARLKLLEQRHRFDAASSARLLAALNVAFYDAAVACWDAKYAYWYIRPPQLDPELKPLFAPPNHPSYPAAHGCLSTAAATVLAAAFPDDRERLLAMGDEAAAARTWAGIHYRFDVDAGQALGREVARRVLERAFLDVAAP